MVKKSNSVAEKLVRDGMGQSQMLSNDCMSILLSLNALILDHWGIVKADIGIKNGRIVGIGEAQQS